MPLKEYSAQKYKKNRYDVSCVGLGKSDQVLSAMANVGLTIEYAAEPGGKIKGRKKKRVMITAQHNSLHALHKTTIRRLSILKATANIAEKALNSSWNNSWIERPMLKANKAGVLKSIS